MDGVEIRVATHKDTFALASLISELGSPTSPEEMQRRVERVRGRSDVTAFVALAEGSIVRLGLLERVAGLLLALGMAGLLVTPSFVRSAPDGQIIALVVAETHRGRGIGRELMKRAEAWLADKGVKRVSLTSGLHRASAHAFYRACSYEQTGLRFVHTIG
jgi:GNAT superfamily N-acetyltransferase